VKLPGKEVEMKALSAVVVLVVLAGGLVHVQQAAATPSLLKATFGNLPIYFVENRGVYPDEVAYYIQGSDKTLFFTKDGITFRLRGGDRDWVVKLDFLGANPDAEPVGADRQRAVFSYFKGPEKDWKTGLRTFSKIVYRDLWPGIDLVYRAGVGALKYEFQVAPGADPGQIRLRYRGASSVSTSDTGALHVETLAGSFEDAPPAAWQEITGQRVPVEMRYRLVGDGEFGFHVGDYDRARALVLDPSVFVYCGYLGGATLDYATAIAVDSAGNTYITGYTDSSELTFPVNVGPDLTYNGPPDFDAFVAKVDALGTRLLYCGYIGGSTWDDAYGIAVDSAGHAYVAGSTYSSEQSFPVTVGPDLTFNGGMVDAFVAKVNPQGTALLYCGYIGGNQRDVAQAIAVDGAGQVCVTGWTRSSEQSFPVTVGPDLTFNGGGYDAFVAKVHGAGTGLLYCGYIGGTGSESGDGIAADAAGNAYVTGTTISNEQSFPVVAGPDLTHNGNDDAFVAKVNPQGTALVYCGYIGGISVDIAYGIAVDGAGSAYIAGGTCSDAQTFPVAVGPGLTFVGPSQSTDAFVAKINPSGTGLVYCGYIGGIGQEDAFGIALDPSGNAYVTGYTLSDQRSFPVRIGPDLTYKGGSTVYGGDAFVAKVSATGGGLAYCGYINGVGDDYGNSIAVDAAGNVYVCGTTQSNEHSFPVVAGPDLTFNGSTDAFVAKLAFTLLQAGGDPRPGGTVSLLLTAVGSVGLPYQLGSSLGTGPIPIDTRQIDLSLDALLAVSTTDLWPAIFCGYRGIIDSQNQAAAALCVPKVSALIGTRIHTAYVILDPQAPSGIRWISNMETFAITK
jgi:hypothetical protein